MHGYVRHDFPKRHGASAGKGFMPFHKQCSTDIPKSVVVFQIGGGIFQRLGHFLWKGMKPFPALGKCDPCMNMYVMISPSSVGASAGGMQVFAILAAWRENKTLGK